MQSNNQATIKKIKRTSEQRGDGVVPNARHDADVIHMISAELDSRVAAVREMIAKAAYFRAEKRGFESGHELDDWLAAEEEVEQRLQQQSKSSAAETRSES